MSDSTMCCTCDAPDYRWPVCRKCGLDKPQPAIPSPAPSVEPSEPLTVDEQVPLWDAINEYAEAMGGRQEVINEKRVVAVNKTNRAVLAIVSARLRARHAPASQSQPAAFPESAPGPWKAGTLDCGHITDKDGRIVARAAHRLDIDEANVVRDFILSRVNAVNAPAPSAEERAVELVVEIPDPGHDEERAAVRRTGAMSNGLGTFLNSTQRAIWLDGIAWSRAALASARAARGEGTT